MKDKSVRWDKLTNEELCVEFQQTRNNTLFEYFYNRNKGLIGLEFGNRMQMYKDWNDDGNLAQFGRIAMFEAMNSFDSSLGYKFTTYFHWWALKEKMEHRRETLPLEVPRTVYSDMSKIREINLDIISLENPIHSGTDDNCPSLNEVISDSSVNIEEELITKMSTEALNQLLIKALRPRESQCLKMYFGIFDGEKHTLQEIGDRYGVTRERIRQVIKKAIRKCRQFLKEGEL